MNKPTLERIKSLTATAEQRAEKIRTSKAMAFPATDDTELQQALADQQFCCALAEAWAQLCSEATQRIIELQPPG
jgi:hypothetical protein